MGITAAQIRAARALLGWNQERLAGASLVGVATIRRFESGGTQEMGALQERAIRQALEGAGVEFLDMRGVALREARQWPPRASARSQVDVVRRTT